MKRFFSLLLALMLLVGSAVAESEVRAFTADEQAYDAYLDIAQAYADGVFYLEELCVLWNKVINTGSNEEIGYSWFSDYLLVDFNRFNAFHHYANSVLGTSEVQDLIDYFVSLMGSNTEKTDVIWLCLSILKDANYVEDAEAIKQNLDNAMAGIRSLMATDREYPFLKDLQTYYKDAVLLYEYIADFNDNYTGFTAKLDEFQKNKTSWEVDFEFIYNPDDFDHVRAVRKQATMEKLGTIYLQATELENAGKYAEALELYWDIYPYDGSSDALERCNAALREEQDEINEVRYQEAYSKEENGDYLTALSIYEELDGYKDSNTRAEVCREKQTQQAFEGKWSWVASNLLEQNVYYDAYNPYDAYFTIDFEKMTITQKFESSTTQFSKVHKFKIVSPTIISCESFRGEHKTWYFHITEEGNNLALTLDASRTPIGEKSMHRID